MEDYIGKICPYCKTEIKEGDAVKVCPSCGIPHHENCWTENKGCTTFGCSEQHYEQQNTNPTTVCANCGTPLGDAQKFCPKCGTPKSEPKKNFCSKCGAELQEGQEFCSKCGQKADLKIDANVNSAISQFNASVVKKGLPIKPPVLIGIIAGVVVLVIVLIIVLTGGSKVDFQEIYNQYCNSSWAEVGSDNSYLSIDSNPYDYDDEGLYYPEAYTAVENINKALGLPESLMEEMGETRGADGRLSETFEDAGVTVTWSYHPDKGFEVTYRQAN